MSDQTLLVYAKGSPKEMIDLCTHYRYSKAMISSRNIRVNGLDSPMTEEVRFRSLNTNDSFADEGLRVLAIAVREMSSDVQLSVKSVEQSRKFEELSRFNQFNRIHVPRIGCYGRSSKTRSSTCSCQVPFSGYLTLSICFDMKRNSSRDDHWRL